jgi:hypothetical protein
MPEMRSRQSLVPRCGRRSCGAGPSRPDAGACRPLGLRDGAGRKLAAVHLSGRGRWWTRRACRRTDPRKPASREERIDRSGSLRIPGPGRPPAAGAGARGWCSRRCHGHGGARGLLVREPEPGQPSDPLAVWLTPTVPSASASAPTPAAPSTPPEAPDALGTAEEALSQRAPPCDAADDDDGWADERRPGHGRGGRHARGSWASCGRRCRRHADRGDSAFDRERDEDLRRRREVLLLAAQERSRACDGLRRPPARHGRRDMRQLATMQSGFLFVPTRPLQPLAVAKDLQRVMTAADIVVQERSPDRHAGGPGGTTAQLRRASAWSSRRHRQATATVLRRDLLCPGGPRPDLDAARGGAGAPLTVAVDRSATHVVDPAGGYLPPAAAGRGGAGMAADALSLARWGYLLYGVGHRSEPRR